MDHIANHPATADMQAADAAHHLHPFTDTAGINEKGARIITSANGVMLRDSEGAEILDAMAGLWCVNIGYGRNELADVASRQMRELPYYNTFFQTSHPPVIALAEKIAALILLLAPGVQSKEDRFTLPFSRKDIADLLGLSEETVCRQMANMNRNGVIYAPRGKMRIQDWDGLRAIAGGHAA